MANKEIFQCDQCHEQSPPVNRGESLPYLYGWRELTSFGFRASPDYTHETILKHFCSDTCLLHHVEQFMREQQATLATVQAEKVTTKSIPELIASITR